MTFTPRTKGANRADFVFIGEHPAVDFANTVVISGNQLTDLLRDWADVVNWLSQAGLSNPPPLQIPPNRRRVAVKRIVELRQGWTEEMNKIIADGKVGDVFIERLNQLLAEDLSHEILHRSGKTGLDLGRSASQLRGEKLALALVAREIARFLAAANLSYLHRCANTSLCVLYFYDTTKNHRRQWCSVAACGNRHKVAQFRKRRATGIR